MGEEGKRKVGGTMLKYILFSDEGGTSQLTESC
jgi:hypothetical protein